jgi:hypothetical protein
VISRLALVSFSVVALVGACSSSSSEEGGDSFAEGKLSNNGLVLDFAILDGLEPGPLSIEQGGPAQVNEDLFGTLLSSENGQELFAYVVTCALREDQSIRVASTDSVYSGNLGLADHWIDGECDTSCQRWISSCVLAHTNAGESVQLSPRGAHPSLSWTRGIEKEFDFEEAAYYGNLFLPEGERFASVCGGDTLYKDSLSSGEVVDPVLAGASFLSGRIHSGGSDIVFTGPCNSFDGLAAACGSRDGGYYSACSTSDDLTESAILMAEVITVFLSR